MLFCRGFSLAGGWRFSRFGPTVGSFPTNLVLFLPPSSFLRRSGEGGEFCLPGFSRGGGARKERRERNLAEEEEEREKKTRERKRGLLKGGEEDEEEEKVRNKGRREGGRAHFVFVASTRGATRRKGKEGTHTRKKKRKEGRRGEEGCPFLLAEEVWEEVNTATMAEGGTL